ncbi:hypothetical protein VRK_19240 [Vibrio sp. MEBiC08052]|nr:hypothetical protein VRK_19240 [Vibrio sp. MEBiC08052]
MNSPREINRELFYSHRGICPFCNKGGESIHSHALVDCDTLPGANWHKVEKVWECSCGWWEYYFYSYINGERSWGMKDWELTVNSGMLREFEIGSCSIPIEILRNYIQKNKNKIYDIHHKKMEELVGSIFREHFNCEASVVGKSSDGGVDLVLLESNKPTIVQVKRRTRPDKTESVKEIRDLLGATLLQGSKSSIFVTTADHFSSDAINTRNKALTKNLVESFELYDFGRFCGLLDLHKKDEVKRWVKMLQLPSNTKA